MEMSSAGSDLAVERLGYRALGLSRRSQVGRGYEVESTMCFANSSIRSVKVWVKEGMFEVIQVVALCFRRFCANLPKQKSRSIVVMNGQRIKHESWC